MADSLNNVKILAVILFMLCSCERAKLQVPSDVVLQKDVQQHGTPKSVMETHIMKDPIAMKAHNLLTRVNNKIENFQNLLTDHRFAVEDPENGNKANILSPSKLKHAQLHLEKLTRLHSKMKIMLQKRKNQLKKMAQSKLKSTTTSVSNSKQIDTTTTVSPKHTTYISVQVAEPIVDTNQPSIDTTAEFGGNTIKFGGNTISTPEQNQTAEQANVETTVQPSLATQPNQTAESKPTDKFTSQMKSKDFFTIIQTLLAELRNVTSPGTNPDDDHTAEKVVGRKNHKIVMVKFPAKEKKSGAQMNSKWDETFSNVQTTQNTLDSDNFVLTKNEEFYYDGVDNDTDVVDNDTDGLDNDTEQKGN